MKEYRRWKDYKDDKTFRKLVKKKNDSAKLQASFEEAVAEANQFLVGVFVILALTDSGEQIVLP